MIRHVWFKCSYWRDTADWPQAARWVFLWSWTNLDVHGVSGIGEVADVIVRAETGLSAGQVQAGWQWLQEHGYALRVGNWYWVVERIDHTRRACGTPRALAGYVTGIAAFIAANHVPDQIVEAMEKRYGDILSEDLMRLRKQTGEGEMAGEGGPTRRGGGGGDTRGDGSPGGRGHTGGDGGGGGEHPGTPGTGG